VQDMRWVSVGGKYEGDSCLDWTSASRKWDTGATGDAHWVTSESLIGRVVTERKSNWSGLKNNKLRFGGVVEVEAKVRN
jgi:hypothetical protein